MPMKKSYFLLLAVLLWGCSTFEEEVLPAPGDSPRQLSVSAVEEPGPDPGSLEIMQRAVDSVAAHSGQRSRSASVSGAQIEPTHRYVRFSPATKAQFDALFDQDEFTCYNFPLDEVSPVSADEGFRMSGPSDTPEQLYAVLRTTVVLPDTIASEVLRPVGYGAGRCGSSVGGSGLGRGSCFDRRRAPSGENNSLHSFRRD